LQGAGVQAPKAWRRAAQVMEGVQEGTLFDRDVVDNMSSRAASRAPSDAGDDVAAAATCASRELALAARAASRALQALPTQARRPHSRLQSAVRAELCGVCPAGQALCGLTWLRWWWRRGSPCHRRAAWVAGRAARRV
jgi:hypothetical protein